MDDIPYYWIIETWEKDTIRVKPQYANAVQDKIASGEGFIRMPNRSINVKDIKSFEQSDIIVSDRKLLTEASEALSIPVVTQLQNGDETVSATWVKKNVKQSRYDKYYRNHPSYIPIADNGTSVTVAFVVPSHLVDPERVTKMTPEEISRLRK